MVIAPSTIRIPASPVRSGGRPNANPECERRHMKRPLPGGWREAPGGGPRRPDGRRNIGIGGGMDDSAANPFVMPSAH